MSAADLTESMVPVACELACRVRDGDAGHIGRMAEDRGWDTETTALLVVLAAMVPVDDASPNDLLAWTEELEAAIPWRQETLTDAGGNPPKLQPCGTYAAYRRHERRGERIDLACDEAYRAYRAELHRAKADHASAA
jgi:hypothetical protein